MHRYPHEYAKIEGPEKEPKRKSAKKTGDEAPPRTASTKSERSGDRFVLRPSDNPLAR